MDGANSHRNQYTFKKMCYRMSVPIPLCPLSISWDVEVDLMVTVKIHRNI